MILRLSLFFGTCEDFNRPWAFSLCTHTYRRKTFQSRDGFCLRYTGPCPDLGVLVREERLKLPSPMVVFCWRGVKLLARLVAGSNGEAVAVSCQVCVSLLG